MPGDALPCPKSGLDAVGFRWVETGDVAQLVQCPCQAGLGLRLRGSVAHGARGVRTWSHPQLLTPRH